MSSGNSLDYSKEDWDQLSSIGAAVKEMEAAGISWVTHLHDVPFLALKAITDIVDGDRPAQEEFLENLHAAAKALQVRVHACCIPHEQRGWQYCFNAVQPLCDHFKRFLSMSGTLRQKLLLLKRSRWPAWPAQKQTIRYSASK